MDDGQSFQIKVLRTLWNTPPFLKKGNLRLFLFVLRGFLGTVLRAVVVWIMSGVLKNLKPLSSTLRRLAKYKRKHKLALQLVGYIAFHDEYFDFFRKGYFQHEYFDFFRKGCAGEYVDGATSFPAGLGTVPKAIAPAGRIANAYKNIDSFDLFREGDTGGYRHRTASFPASPGTASEELVGGTKVPEETSLKPDIRWYEPPLITGAKLGLHEFVLQIINYNPKSATDLDVHGINVLQAAIKYRRKEIVKRIVVGGVNNPLFQPSWLCSHVHDETRNTILHFASENIEKTKGDAVQLQDEIKWFEMVKEMLPKELWNYRNREEKTAQELFTEEHEKMLESCKTELTDMGKTCSGLVAAVVFASSFSIPGEKDQSTGNPLYFNRLAFKVFSNAYVIGFGCATTSLALFLSLVITPHKQSDFRRAVPVTYFLACLSFGMALSAFLISFTCNFYLQIYGGQRSETKDLIPLILELTVFPAVCFIVLLYKGARFGPSFSRIWSRNFR